MKKTLLIAFIFFQTRTFAQDMIYLADGSKIPGKIAEITDEKVKFKNLANPTGPFYSRNINNVQFAFNAAGNYLVFGQPKPITDKDKDEFINPVAKPRPVDIVVELDGKLSAVEITDENETEIAASDNGKIIKLLKSNIAFLIRKNGDHHIYSALDQALTYLSIDKSKINALLSSAKGSSNPPTVLAAAKPLAEAIASKQPSSPSVSTAELATKTAKTAPAESTKILTHAANEILEPDMAVFGAKALEKTHEFTLYLQAITNVKTNRDEAKKSITQACDLFLNQGADVRVEVSNVNTQIKKKYKIIDYLNRLMIKAGQFDKVNIEYADINYASKFEKGADGNYYGTVTFVQKFQGFVDGNLVYGDQTKRSMTIVLQHYEKEVNGEKVAGWDVYLDNIGVVETKNL